MVRQPGPPSSKGVRRSTHATRSSSYSEDYRITPELDSLYCSGSCCPPALPNTGYRISSPIREKGEPSPHLHSRLRGNPSPSRRSSSPGTLYHRGYSPSRFSSPSRHASSSQRYSISPSRYSAPSRYYSPRRYNKSPNCSPCRESSSPHRSSGSCSTCCSTCYSPSGGGSRSPRRSEDSIGSPNRRYRQYANLQGQ